MSALLSHVTSADAPTHDSNGSACEKMKACFGVEQLSQQNITVELRNSDRLVDINGVRWSIVDYQGMVLNGTGSLRTTTQGCR